MYLNFGTNDLAYHETLIQLNMVLIKFNVNAFFHLEYFLICWQNCNQSITDNKSTILGGCKNQPVKAHSVTIG